MRFAPLSHAVGCLVLLGSLGPAGPAPAAMAPGAHGDGIADLHVGGRDLILHTDGAGVNGFVLTSRDRLLAGEPYADRLGLFVTDADALVADQLAYRLDGLHDLGRVLRAGATFEDLGQDLTLSYTVAGEQGIRAATLLRARSGDADLDGTVGHDDFVTLRSAFGTPAGAVWVKADFTGDGAVDFRDYIAQKRHVAPPGARALAPEPLTWALLAAGALALRRRRGR